MSDVVRLDVIKTRPQNEEYRKGWDRIFGGKQPEAKRESEECPNCCGCGVTFLADSQRPCDGCGGSGVVYRLTNG